MLLNKTNIFKRLFTFIMCVTLTLSIITVFREPIKAEARTQGYQEDMAWQVLDIVNQERAAAGLAPLTMDAKLIEAAKVRGPEIVTKFDHTRPDGSSCFSVFPNGLGWQGENIAAGQMSSSSVMTAWMNSSGHRANILSSNFKSIGIVCYYVPNSQYKYYWVQCFGGRVLEEAERPSSTVYNGVDYSAVYDYKYYINNYADLKAAFGTNPDAALAHFVNNGMNEGRQAKADFNVSIYKNNYADLRNAFGNDLKSYYMHYINNGKSEGRNAKTAISGSSNNNNSGSSSNNGGNANSGLTVYQGVDYSAVYDFNYYLNNNADVRAVFGNNQTAVLAHFVNYGMNEGRQANASFNVNKYKNNYADLRAAFGNNLKAYYMHYINYGKREGRNASSGSGSAGGQSSSNYDGMDFGAVFDADYYLNKYADLKAAFGTNKDAAFNHFVEYGMNEGRQAKADFNVNAYKNRYADLRNAFGNNTKEYYIHFIKYGKKEGRVAN